MVLYNIPNGPYLSLLWEDDAIIAAQPVDVDA